MPENDSAVHCRWRTLNGSRLTPQQDATDPRASTLAALAWPGTVPGVRCRGDAAGFVAGDDVSTRLVSDPSPGAITWLNCVHCDRKIARNDARIEVNDKHEHTFINPAGVIYRIGCFASAPGAGEVGRFSAEFAWFRGHVWRCLTCGDCQTHLGWSFTAEASRFFGLILTELRDGPSA
jgi:hypothetical protein